MLLGQWRNAAKRLMQDFRPLQLQQGEPRIQVSAGLSATPVPTDQTSNQRRRPRKPKDNLPRVSDSHLL
jgi:hypothetical protein